ncbi:hypothetical protein SODG_002608 [Sodalis praecaptivus]
MRQVIFNPNLFPEENMPGKIDRPEEYVDIATNAWRTSAKNRDRCLVLLSRQDDALDVNRSAGVLAPFYEIIWDEQEGHKFKNISHHLQRTQAFKALG